MMDASKKSGCIVFKLQNGWMTIDLPVAEPKKNIWLCHGPVLRGKFLELKLHGKSK
jgi:hypothetical protein